MTDAALTVLEPHLLSLGTCQQLYLALRIALLMCAENVGRSIPILADDILVNFDAERRVGAARVLVELSRKRQVIVFTCHREVVDALCRAAEEVVDGEVTVSTLAPAGAAPVEPTLEDGYLAFSSHGFER